MPKSAIIDKLPALKRMYRELTRSMDMKRKKKEVTLKFSPQQFEEISRKIGEKIVKITEDERYI